MKLINVSNRESRMWNKYQRESWSSIVDMYIGGINTDESIEELHGRAKDIGAQICTLMEEHRTYNVCIKTNDTLMIPFIKEDLSDYPVRFWYPIGTTENNKYRFISWRAASV